MHITVADLELEVASGVTTAEIVAYVRAHGAALPDRPWCGSVRLSAEHRAGTVPLIEACRLSPAPGLDTSPQPGLHLAVLAGPDCGAVQTLREGLIVGRSADAGLVINDPHMSANHLLFAKGRVRNLGSRNGASLNGRRLRRRRRIEAADSMRLGDTVLAVIDATQPQQEDARGAGKRSGAKRSALTMAGAGGGALSMVMIAVMTGHPLFAVAGLAMVAATVAPHIVGSRRQPPERALFDVSGTYAGAPKIAGPIAVTGPRGLIRAVTLATGRPDQSARQWEPWMRWLAPASSEVLWLQRNADAPSWALTSVTTEATAVVVTSAGVTQRGPVPLVGLEAADASARRLAATSEFTFLPRTVRWADLPPPTHGGLKIRLGMGAKGPVECDLVADGPHVLVAGTTGSGKSEALRTLIASLAYDYTPQQVCFALIDFKGGAGLGPCATLPHVASVLTDLEPHLARRALLALSAELADRKHKLASAGATTYDEWRDERPPRLVIVVDEFQEIAAADRDFVPSLARIAAQGRSLGIHLVLATQRPAGAVSAEIRANVSATIALRTASESESRDLIGSSAAAELPATAPGRAIIVRGTSAEPLHVATPIASLSPRIRLANQPPDAGTPLVDAARDRHTGTPAPALWLPELPATIRPASLAGSGTGRITLGVADIPHRRVRAPAFWTVDAGPLIITGPPRSGRTETLSAVAAQAHALGKNPVWLSGDARMVVRTLSVVLDRSDTLLLVDDAARVLQTATALEPEVPELLMEAIARGPVAISVPPAWATHRLVNSAAVRIVFTGLAAEDDTAWGVATALRALAPRSGRARVGDTNGWHEVQLALALPHTPVQLITPLPHQVTGTLPQRALGIGGDDARPILVPEGAVTVIGPPGAERDTVARRLHQVTGAIPHTAETIYAPRAVGASEPRTVVVVRPTARLVRDVARDAPRGLIEAAHIPLRVVAVIDSVPCAVQVLAA